MKYIKGVNINFDDRAYLQQHFEEEESHGIAAVIGADQSGARLTAVPDEFKGVRVELLEQNIRRLELDMEAEIQTIRMRYQEKIRYMEDVVRVVRESQGRPS